MIQQEIFAVYGYVGLCDVELCGPVKYGYVSLCGAAFSYVVLYRAVYTADYRYVGLCRIM